MANNGRPKLCCPQPRTKEERDRCRTLFESGSSYREISETVGTPISTLRVWRKRDQWKVTTLDVAGAPAMPDKDVEIPEDLPEQAAQYEDDMRVAALKFSNHVKNLPAAEIAAKADRIKSLDVVNRKALRIESEKPLQVINLAVLCGSSPAKAARDKADQGQLRSAHRPTLLIESGE